jgi:trehalose 6-phosphate phosphatase
MPATSSTLPLPPPPAREWSYYLDLDGTLLAIADRPDTVTVPAELPRILGRLVRSTGGAVAIVTGRSIAEVDRFLTPLILPVAGLHGLERRDANGSISRGEAPADALDLVRRAFTRFARGDRHLIVEDKGLTVALHYRLAPQRAEQALELGRRLALEVEGALHLLRGKAVIEFHPPTGDKGQAITQFQAEPPFAGRSPVFVGDDVTDEDGFRCVNAVRGVSIKIGGGATAARYALPTVTAVHAWLARAGGRG